MHHGYLNTFYFRFKLVPLFFSREHASSRIAFILCFILVVIIAIFAGIYGKTNSFLLVNSFNNPYLDFCFQYITYLGDGIIWVPVFLYVFFYKRKYMVLIISALLISTLFTQLLKHAVFPNDLRPIGVFTNKLHLIKGLYINRQNSFPSGHTATAFTLAVVLPYIRNKRYLAIIFPIAALLVGYSRVYLAQHFVTDVLAGAVIGMLSGYLSIVLQLMYAKNQKRKLARQGEASLSEKE